MGVGVVGWVISAVIVGLIAQNVGRSFGSYFALSLFLSPIIGLVVLLIKGKATKDEILDNNKHIFYCKKCGKTFGGFSSNGSGIEFCPECGEQVLETRIFVDDWRTFSNQKKQQMKDSFARGSFLRNVDASAGFRDTAIGGADELKKYKELLDSGIITQEEFEAKKKQLLGL